MSVTRRPEKLVGEVLDKNGYNFVLKTDGPPYLETMELTPHEMGDAKVGDVVELVFESTATYGLWRVSKVLEAGPISEEEEALQKYLP